MKTFSQIALALVGMTGLAAAQPKADPKAADSKTAPKPADAKPAGGMPETKPPVELAELAKAASGTWTCKGQGVNFHTAKMEDMTATMKMKIDVAGWWMHSSFESKMGKDPFQYESFTTIEPTTKKWKRVLVESGGNWATGESSGLKDNKVDWELTTHSSTMGEGMFREHEDLSDPKAGVKLKGEFSPDKGKTWAPVYEMACKK
jgi:hypothetical protein